MINTAWLYSGKPWLKHCYASVDTHTGSTEPSHGVLVGFRIPESKLIPQIIFLNPCWNIIPKSKSRKVCLLYSFLLVYQPHKKVCLLYSFLSVYQPHRKGEPVQEPGECVPLGLPTTKTWSQPCWTPWSCHFLNQARLWACRNARYYCYYVEEKKNKSLGFQKEIPSQASCIDVHIPPPLSAIHQPSIHFSLCFCQWLFVESTALYAT